jgi:hypothetical protein
MANRARIVIKRPLIHYLISLGYILAPIVNIVLLMVIARIPLSDIVHRLFQGYGTLAGIWLLSAPIVGIGLYFVHKISWYIFLGHSGLILLDYVLKWVTHPVWFWLSIPGAHQLLLLTGNLALIVVIGYIIHKDFRAPYFQVLPRGWRTTRRVAIRHCIEIKGQRCTITDLSAEGCFVSEPQLELTVGEKATINFQGDTMKIRCTGEVMRSTPQGFGIRFLNLRGIEKRDIRRMIRTRFPFRYKVAIPGQWRFDGRQISAKILDISTSGCYLEAGVEGAREGLEGALQAEILGHKIQLPALIIWINQTGLHDKPLGFGLHFFKKYKRLVRAIANRMNKRTPAG